MAGRERLPAAVAWIATACLAGPLGSCGAGAAPQQVDLALVDVAIVDLELGVVRPGSTLLVDDGSIIAVGSPTEVGPFEAESTIEGAGAHLLPGLWDMHVHDSDEPSVLIAHLAAGVTTVRDLGGSGLGAIATRDRVSSGELPGPRIVASGPNLDGRPDTEGTGARIQVTDEVEARAAVAELAAMGADLVKVHDVMAAQVHAAVADAAVRAGLPVDGHAPRGVPTEQVAAAQRTIEHATTLGEQALRRDALESEAAFERDLAAYLGPGGAGAVMIDALLSNRTAFCPTLVAGLALARASAPDAVVWEDPRLALAPEGMAEKWREWLPVELLPGNFHTERLAVERAAHRIVLAMHERGVVLLAGTDAGAPHVYWGSALHEELALLVEVGLTPLEALRCATTNPARVLDVADRFGALEVGYEADFLMVDGNPLEDLSALERIRNVIVRGEVQPRRDARAGE